MSLRTIDQTRRPKVLIVDDRQSNLDTLGVMLQEVNAEIITASSGKQALHHLLEEDYAVILLDVNMPDMDGFETATLIRDRPRSEFVPIIFTSAVALGDDERLKGYLSGAVDYLTVPIVPEYLKAKVMTFLELYRLRQESLRAKAELEAVNAELKVLVTDREAAQLAIDEINQSLRKANTDLAAFSSSIARNLHGALRTISICATRVCANGSALSDLNRDYLNRILDASHHMNHLTDELLILSRIGKIVPEFTNVDLSDIANEILARLRTEGSQRWVSWNIQPNMTAWTDREIIRSILENLLGNAWKFTGNTLAGHIDFLSEKADEEIHYIVRDNGVGFDMSKADQLGTPFKRLHSKREFSGAGIGLATVQRAISRLGGRFWFDAAPNAGATFYFTLGKKAGSERWTLPT